MISLDQQFLLNIAVEKASDYRDVMPPISLLWRSAELIGLDAALEFQHASSRLPFTSDLLVGYPRLRPESRRISAMYYIESDDQDGFIYRCTK
ncbi:hypothetical protein [Candidatus Protofrankia californiensis]|uniref:hypothetical protein n=1 Tax=Candidatus Protofrankia californiensis TaxID=1839754 RepID=UPI0019CF5CE8|nr:hypothetical protein [Candidatus Protofrankia californiensis]